MRRRRRRRDMKEARKKLPRKKKKKKDKTREGRVKEKYTSGNICGFKKRNMKVRQKLRI